METKLLYIGRERRVKGRGREREKRLRCNYVQVQPPYEAYDQHVRQTHINKNKVKKEQWFDSNFKEHGTTITLIINELKVSHDFNLHSHRHSLTPP